jgi:four helix bundle protein
MTDNPSDYQLGHEKLDVYQCALQFLGLATEAIGKLPSGSRTAADQLDRASLSIVLNIAEGAGKTTSADRHKYFGSARGSAMECGAVLDALLLQNKLGEDNWKKGKRLLVRIVQMLSKM